MEYKDVILENVRQAMEKRDKASSEEEANYYQWVISELIRDLREYENEGTWINVQGFRFNGVDDLLRWLLGDAF